MSKKKFINQLRLAIEILSKNLAWEFKTSGGTWLSPAIFADRTPVHFVMENLQIRIKKNR